MSAAVVPRLIFAGTPHFAVPALTALLAGNYEVVAVYTQPDRPAGRGRQAQASPVKQVAATAGIPVQQPAGLRSAEAVAALREYASDLMIVAAYGLLLPPAVLAAPRLGCVNIHASLLPRWRGAAPIQRALAAGDTETGISIMQMEAGLDTGPVYATRAIPIAPRDTGGSLHDRLAGLGAATLLETLPGLLAGRLVPVPQAAQRATYAPKLTKAEARIDWTQPAVQLDRLIRAFDPWPVAETRLGGETLRLWAAQPREPVAGPLPGPPGRVLAAGRDGIDVATGAGLLRITRLQAPGKRPLAAADFCNARDLTGALFA
ncbi:MAG: methionyl-tRNA formyltransferase [Chromatiaceae bacterium]|nr:MAG: methionyl-tRNA formyltransferase [Chromatiaceae bacterium]